VGPEAATSPSGETETPSPGMIEIPSSDMSESDISDDWPEPDLDSEDYRNRDDWEVAEDNDDRPRSILVSDTESDEEYDGDPLWSDTPHEIIERIRSINGTPVPDHGIANTVRELTRFSLPGRRVPRLIPMFYARTTGRTYCHFYCRVQGCPALFSIRIHNGLMSISHEAFEHDHLIAEMSIERARLLSARQTETIHGITQTGGSADQCRMVVGYSVKPQTLGNARRPILKKGRLEQASQLYQLLQTWEDMDCQMRCDEENVCEGCYFFQKLLRDTLMVKDTLIIDDTACTNYFDFPLLLILALDEHAISQLVAFAFIKNRTEESYKAFFNWVAKRIGADESTAESPIPRSLVVDRSQSQCNALETVFPHSHIIFCVKHLAANISRKLGDKSPVFQNFWPMIFGTISEEEYVSLIQQELSKKPAQKTEKFLGKLLSMRESYFPSFTRYYSTERTSQRVEGFFGHLKADKRYKCEPLITIAARVRGFGETAMGNADDAKVEPLPLTVMSLEDQEQIGQVAQKIIAEATLEAQKLVKDETVGFRLDRDTSSR
jgi:hypothetical protein